MFKSGFITVAGKPNVGKSSLVNAMVGEKVAIVSWRPQTTRNKINGIMNGEDYQAVFIDTPGIHNSKNQLGEYMMKSVNSALEGVDQVIYVLNAERIPDDNDLDFIREYASKLPVIVAVNKVDAVDKSVVFSIMQSVGNIVGVKEIVPISALKGDNIDLLKKMAVKYLPEAEAYYPEDMYTDKNLRFMAAEIIREKAMRNLSDEVPYGIGVNINLFKEKPNGVVEIDADLICEKKAHKPIIIGKGGAMLKKIGAEARVEIENLLDTRVFLQLWVKIKEEWRDSEYLLNQLGYDSKEL